MKKSCLIKLKEQLFEMHPYWCPRLFVSQIFIDLCREKVLYKLILFVFSNSCIKKYGDNRMMLSVPCFMIEMHFQIIMATINCMT
jgi:hypothetical protein